jgi:hypothetical protein
MLECSWKSHFGVECFGCGFQRSFVLLMEGSFWESLKIFPATIPILLVFVYTGAHLYFKYKNGARNIVILFSASVILILGNFIWRLVQANN